MNYCLQGLMLQCQTGAVVLGSLTKTQITLTCWNNKTCINIGFASTESALVVKRCYKVTG